jgi:hypothetical protein
MSGSLGKLAACAVLVASLGACSKEQALVPSDYSPYVELGVDNEAAFSDLYLQKERHILFTCLQEEGFDVPFQAVGPLSSFQTDGGWTVELASQYGFGISIEAPFNGPPAAEDPVEAILQWAAEDGTSEENLEELKEALLGSEAERADYDAYVLEAFDRGDTATDIPPGCYGATFELFGQIDHVIGPFFDAYYQLLDEELHRPTLLDAYDEWSRCMITAGFSDFGEVPTDVPDLLADEFSRLLSATGGNASEDELAQFQENERAIAVSTLTCESASRIGELNNEAKSRAGQRISELISPDQMAQIRSDFYRLVEVRE